MSWLKFKGSMWTTLCISASHYDNLDVMFHVFQSGWTRPPPLLSPSPLGPARNILLSEAIWPQGIQYTSRLIFCLIECNLFFDVTATLVDWFELMVIFYYHCFVQTFVSWDLNTIFKVAFKTIFDLSNVTFLCSKRLHFCNYLYLRHWTLAIE